MEKFKALLKRKKVWIPSLIVGIVLLSFVIWGSLHYSKSRIIDRYIAAYSDSGDTFENIKGFLIWSDTAEQITNDEAKYAEFTALDASEAQQLSKELKNADESSDYFVKRVGSRWGIFPNYKIAFKPMDLTIKTNVDKVDILLNKKKVVTTNSEDFSIQLERLPIADYTASISGLYKGKKLELSRNYDGQDKVLDLTVSFKNFTVTSNIKDGELYFDDTRVGSLSNGKYEVSDYPLTDAAQAYVKKKYSDGDLRSKEVALSSITEGATVALDVDKLLDEDTAGKVLISTFDQLIAYLNQGQDPSDLSTVFEGGAQNDFYKGLKESVSAKMLTDKRRATSITIPSIWVNNMTQVGKESYLLDFSATYDFYYDESTDSAKRTQGDIIQELVGQVTLKKSGDSYVVSKSGQKSITVTSEENRLKAASIFPEDLIGTWSGKEQGNTITMTFAEDGTVNLKIDFKDDKTPDTNRSAKVTKVEDKGNGLYQYVYDDGADVSAFVVGGIGGVGVKYTYGVQINGSSIKPVVWQTNVNDDFDFSHPLEGQTLTKQ